MILEITEQQLQLLEAAIEVTRSELKDFRIWSQEALRNIYLGEIPYPTKKQKLEFENLSHIFFHADFLSKSPEGRIEVAKFRQITGCLTFSNYTTCVKEVLESEMINYFW